MNASDLLDHYRWRGCSRQWRGFLLAMVDEFVDALPEEEVARLMARIGERFAHAHPLPSAETLAALEGAANAVWASQDWGQVSFDEGPAEVIVTHVAAPLPGAVAPYAVCGQHFLEGVYRTWFREAGMLPQLDLRAIAGTTPDVSRYQLCRIS